MSGSEPRIRPWAYHPFEVAFEGGNGAARAALLSRLAGRLREGGMLPALLRFEAEGDGPAGDPMLLRSGPGFQMRRQGEPLNPQAPDLALLEADVLLVDGPDPAVLPRVLLQAESGNFAGTEGAPPPLALVQGQDSGAAPWDLPRFHRDDAAGLEAFLRSHWRRRAADTPLYGLVLTGGRSTRMGQDKAALVYHGEAQTRHAFRLLEARCEQVFVSCRADQAELPDRVGLPQVHDQILDLGPTSGILSALHRHPAAAWMVLACDLPYLDAATLVRLAEGRNPFRFATAFRGHQDRPEPLCAIYEPKARSRFFQFLALGHRCPRKVLINSPIALLQPAGRALDNVNAPREYEEARRDLRP